MIFALSGFSSAGAGKLIGPDGQEMDNEDLSSLLFMVGLHVYTSEGSTYYNFRVVTQKYGKGIVQYGSEQRNYFPSSS